MNKLVISSILFENFNYESNSIENITDTIKVDNALNGNFYLYLSSKILGNAKSVKYHIFVFLRSREKFKYISDFQIPMNIESDTYGYTTIFSMSKFDFPSKGIYEFVVYGAEETKINEILNGEDDNLKRYKILEKKDDVLLDIIKFNII